MRDLWSITDGVVAIRPPEDGDRKRLIAGRDEEFHRFLGDGSDDPAPTGCIVVAGEVAGWVDFDRDREWLAPDEVNLGYHVFAQARGHGHGTRAVKLLLHHLALSGAARVATLLIDPANHRSLALAERAGFERQADLDGNPYWTLVVPPLAYTDGVVTIRRRQPADLEADLAAKDAEQLRWLWLPWQREAWAGMTEPERRAHAVRVLREDHEGFGRGPKWTFTVDTADQRAVGYVDCDLDNGDVTAGEANLSYACHPGHRGRGYTSRAVRLLAQFVREHTGARTAEILVDPGNGPSLRVARAVGATPVGERRTADGRSMVRHRLHLRERALPPPPPARGAGSSGTTAR